MRRLTPSTVQAHHSPSTITFFTHLILLLVTLLLVPGTSAQVLIGGQVYTNGLAIIDSPQPNSQMHASASLTLAIDVSGDGSLAQGSSIPGSSTTTGFDSLEVYLTSYEQYMNITVSQGPGLLTQESSSTVKHVDYTIPTCIPAGNYNVTVYELSHINSKAYYSITSYPIDIENTVPAGLCTPNRNILLASPQASNPAPANVLENAVNSKGQTGTSVLFTATSSTAPSTASGMTTSFTGALTTSTLPPTTSTLTGVTLTGAITITIVDGESMLPTTPTATPSGWTPTTVTVVYVSMETETITQSGSTITTTVTAGVTTATQVIQPSPTQDNSGFVPVNATSRISIPWLVSFVCAGTVWLSLFVL